MSRENRLSNGGTNGYHRKIKMETLWVNIMLKFMTTVASVCGVKKLLTFPILGDLP